MQVYDYALTETMPLDAIFLSRHTMISLSCSVISPAIRGRTTCRADYIGGSRFVPGRCGGTADDLHAFAHISLSLFSSCFKSYYCRSTPHDFAAADEVIPAMLKKMQEAPLYMPSLVDAD